MPLEKPAVVVALDEGPDHFPGLLEGFEVVQVDALLLERPDEALGDAVALRLAPGPAARGAPTESPGFGVLLAVQPAGSARPRLASSSRTAGGRTKGTKAVLVCRLANR